MVISGTPSRSSSTRTRFRIPPAHPSCFASLQFFQFGWNYAFFYLLNVSPTDTNSNPITVSWVLVQLALQLNVFMQNTGNYEVLLLSSSSYISHIMLPLNATDCQLIAN